MVKEGEEYDMAVVGGSGTAGVVKQSYTIIEQIFHAFFEKHGRQPNDEELSRIALDIQMRLLKRYSRLRSLGVEADASLIVATVSSEGNPHIYLYNDGLLEDRSEEGYAMIGIGRDTGGILLLRLLGYDANVVWDPGVLTTFLIDAIAEVSPYVSPLTSFLDSFYIRHEGGRVTMGQLKPESFLEYKEKAKKRIEMFKKLWLAMEVAGEEEVEKALNKLLEGQKTGQ